MALRTLARRLTTRLPHDVGGLPSLAHASLPKNKPLLPWELEAHALFACLAKDGIFRTDESRRVIESMPEASQREWSYYEKFSSAIATLLREKGVVQPGELEAEIYGDECVAASDGAPKFAVGDSVVVRRREDARTSWRAPHVRTPGYIYGAAGVVERLCGSFADPSLLAFGVAAPRPLNLYRIRFRQDALWPEYGASADTLDVDVYENWLLAPSEQATAQAEPLFDHRGGPAAHHHHDHHDHDHDHRSRAELEQDAVAAEGAPRPGTALHEALVRIAERRGLVTRARLRATAEALETAGATLPGAALVARAWVDASFRDALLADGNAAARSLGIEASNPNAPTHLTVVANEAGVHNVVVCTLCSCYPAALLGPSPSWYRSREYRARAVRQPRALLRDAFGLEIADGTAIRVHDSTADLRYLVLPERPAGSESLDEAALRRLVSRDAMIGVAAVHVDPVLSS